MRKILPQSLVLSLVAAFLCTGLASTIAQAHHCKGAHAGDSGCDGGGGGGGGDAVAVTVTLDDIAGDTLVSDGAAYIDGADKITAEIVDIGFRMTPENKSTRTATIDFGPLVDCTSGTADSSGDCITDALFAVPITCPIDAGNRIDGSCKGARTINLFFRDVFLDATTVVHILSMPADGQQYPGQHFDPELFLISPASKKNGWALIFKPNPGLTACQHLAENLGITAFDDGDGVTDSWVISTETVDGPSKIACLAKNDPGKRTFEGYVTMQFGLTIERQF